MSLKIGELLRNLKLLARKYAIAIVLIHHTRKTEVEDTPTIADLRDSSLVAQESDYVIMVSRMPEKQTRQEKQEYGMRYTNKTRVDVVKNRLTGQLDSFVAVFENYNLNVYESPEAIEERRRRNQTGGDSFVPSGGTDAATSDDVYEIPAV